MLLIATFKVALHETVDLPNAPPLPRFHLRRERLRLPLVLLTYSGVVYATKMMEIPLATW